MKKRFLSSVLLTILMVTLGFGYSPTSAAASASQPAPLNDDAGAAYVPGQMIVGLAPSISLGSFAARASAVAQAVGAKVLKTDGQSMVLLDIGGHRNPQALALTVKRIKGVRYAEPNYVYTSTAAAANQNAGASAGLMATQASAASPSLLGPNYPNDPYLLLNAGYQYVGADIVWKNTTPSKTVCLLDSGVDYKHKDLAANVIKGYNFVSDNADPMDDFGQGTHLAGIIAAVRNNGEGITGVSTGKVLAVKVLDANGGGTAFDVA